MARGIERAETSEVFASQLGSDEIEPLIAALNAHQPKTLDRIGLGRNIPTVDT